MKFWLALLISWPAMAVELSVTGVEYFRPADMGSCGLLRARELERQKVIRELIHLNRLAQKGRTAALLEANHLLVNKLFMPDETWRDLHAEVVVTAAVPEGMRREIERVGVGQVFLSTRAPGFVWHSFIYQLPPEMAIEADVAAGVIRVRYRTYLNVLCEEPLPAPQLDWIPEAEAPTRPNSRVSIEQILFMLRK